MTVTIFDIARNSYVDGPGIRTTVFFKGCNLHCAWCHNPESQSHTPQMLFYKNKCTACGKCAKKCPNGLLKCDLCGKCVLYCPHDAREICGKGYTVDDVIQELLKDKALYKNSGGGVTFSGGECMLQIDFLEECLKACKEHGIHTAVDTAGHVPYERFERILSYTDLLLYDVKCFDSEKHKQYTGVENTLILENLGKLLATEKSVWVRIPIIPTVNDTEEELRKIKEFLSSYGAPQKIELLPYHAMGEHKYAALGKEAQVFSVPDKEKTEQLKHIFFIKIVVPNCTHPCRALRSFRTASSSVRSRMCSLTIPQAGTAYSSKTYAGRNGRSRGVISQSSMDHRPRRSEAERQCQSENSV